MNLKFIAMMLYFISNSSFATKFYPLPDDVEVLNAGPGVLIALQDIKASDDWVTLRNGQHLMYNDSQLERNQLYWWSMNDGGYCRFKSNVDFPKGEVINFIYDRGLDIQVTRYTNDPYWVTKYSFQPDSNGSKFPMLLCYLQEGTNVAKIGQFRAHFGHLFEIKSIHNYNKK